MWEMLCRSGRTTSFMAADIVLRISASKLGVAEYFPFAIFSSPRRSWRIGVAGIMIREQSCWIELSAIAARASAVHSALVREMKLHRRICPMFAWHLQNGLPLVVWLLLAIVSQLAPSASAIAEESQRPARPNIVLVFIDDMGWADLSCFGNTEAETPNIDRMAREGIAFEQFYVNSPICSPSRVAISTGQYPQRWSITSYLADRDKNRQRGMADWLDPAAPMLARALKEDGYATGHFGKWHMGGQRDVDDAPPISAYGFDASLTNFEGMGAKLLPLTLVPGQNKPGRIWVDAERLGGPVRWMQRSKITGGFAEAAETFIEHAQAEGKPFYINLWPDDVHSPFYPPVDKWREGKRGIYLAVLEEADRQLGVLFDYIRENKRLRDNTLVLICSDNGHEPGAGAAADLKGSKGQLYEGGVRSPLIVWGPGLIAKNATGSRNKKSVIAAIDLVPSLEALSGVKHLDAPCDGQDLLPVLLGRSDASRDGPLFFSRPPHRKHYDQFKNLPDLAVRQGDWKLLCDVDGSREQLYNLKSDRGETKNRVVNEPQIAADLKQKLLDWYHAMPIGKSDARK